MNRKEILDKLEKYNHVDLLFPSKYLKACDLQGRDVTVTIEYIEPRDELKMRGGKTEKKPTVKLVGKEKLWVINKTNAQAIAKLHGPELTGWIGKSVTIYPTKTTFGKDEVECVRVRPTAPNGNGKKKPADDPESDHDPDTGEVASEHDYGPPPMEDEPGSNG